MSQQPLPPASPQLLWWMLWGSIGAGMAVSFVMLKQPNSTSNAALWWLPVLPLLGATLVRFLLLPRMRERTKALPIFIAGLALADSSMLAGIFLSGKYSVVFLGLAYAVWAFYAPVFAKDLK